MAKRWKTVSFVYLGSAITKNNSSDLEVERRVQPATKAFGALQKRLWSRCEIRRSTKVNVYNTAVLPALLYSTECMTLCRRHIRKLTSVQLRHLRTPYGLRGLGGKVTSAGWKVTLCDPIWYVVSRSSKVKFTNCYTLLYLLPFYLRIDPLRLLAGCRKRRLNQAPLNFCGLI